MIIDIVLIILVVLALAYGIYKGFAGVLLGFVGTIIIAVSLAVGVFFLAPSVMFKDRSEGVSVVVDENGANPEGYTGLFMLLYKPISEKFLDPEDSLMSAELVKVGDILQLKIWNENGDDYSIVKFSVAVSESVPFFKSNNDDENEDTGVETVSVMNENENENSESPKTSDDGEIQTLDYFITYYGCEGLTVGHAIGAFVTLFVLCLIIWHVAFYSLLIIKFIIRRLIFRALDRNSVASKVDRAIGALVTVVVIVCVAWLAISLAGTIVEGIGMGDEFWTKMETNPICKFFAEHSMLGGSASEPPANDGTTSLIAKAVSDIVIEKIY